MPAPSARRLVVLINAKAGSAKDELARQIAELFAARGCDAQLRVVGGDGIADATREAVREGAPLIAAGGGDGTISAVASVLAGGETTLGVLPLGTLNHFARDLRIPLQLEAAVDAIADGHTIRVDVGEVNERIFLNNSSLGVYPNIVAAREREQRKGHRKLVAFALALIRVWRRYPLMVVTLSGELGARTVRTPFVFVGNGEYDLHGLDFTRRHSLTSGRLHICLAPDISRFEGVRMVFAAMIGRLHHLKYFEAFLLPDVIVDAPREVAISLDGEVTMMPSPFRYRIRPQSLRVIVPRPAANE